jgi:hypothetical protein
VPLLWAGSSAGHLSPSEADYALLGRLAFWTGDPDRMARLFRQSGLHRPEKDEGYVERTVRTLLTNYRGSFYDPKAQAREAGEVLSGTFWEVVYRTAWPSMSGPTNHNTLIALAMAAMEKGAPKGEGASVKVRRENLVASCSLLAEWINALPPQVDASSNA